MECQFPATRRLEPPRILRGQEERTAAVIHPAVRHMSAQLQRTERSKDAQRHASPRWRGAHLPSCWGQRGRGSCCAHRSSRNTATWFLMYLTSSPALSSGTRAPATKASPSASIKMVNLARDLCKNLRVSIVFRDSPLGRRVSVRRGPARGAGACCAAPAGRGARSRARYRGSPRSGCPVRDGVCGARRRRQLLRLQA